MSNLDRFKAKLAALPKVAKDEMRKAVADSAEEIVDLQKRLAPVDDGDLQMSIKWRWGNEKREAYSQDFGSISGSHELSARIFAGDSKVRYAHLVEFGAAPHIAGGKFEGAQHPGSPKQPFFYPGWRTGKKRAKSRISRAITKAAKRVAAE
ncbi:HK97 gp10 family phage protein [Rhizobium sp. KVB221]|uniref:HK97 gp10 family phage protein n=1 Tax=Rhizobium setariae TaxID=2801340 RepID=A0A937CQK5_9HYPH|nr:HK97 gp10 family phage protein [Rhizobium setariae]